MQPPARSKEREKEYKNTVISTPDELDMLVTSKNHDLKSAVADRAGFDEWIFALITLQTMDGNPGRNPGISRMNRSHGNRPAFSITPSERFGIHIKRDITALQEYRPELLEKYAFYPPNKGISLLWNQPWNGDGTAEETLNLKDLDLLYIEICRLVRLRQYPHGDLHIIKATAKKERINAQCNRGVTGDPWAPVDHRDKKGPKVLTLSSGGFTYKRVADYLTSADWEIPVLLKPTLAERHCPETMQLVARAMVRGQGETKGYHERTIPMRHRAKTAMLRRDSTRELGDISKSRIDQIGSIQNFLKDSVATFIAKGKNLQALKNNERRQVREKAELWSSKLDEIVDARFFEDLQDELEAEESERQNIRNQWLLNRKDGVIDHARALLDDAADSLPCPTIHRYKARTNAEGLFEWRLRGNGGFPDLFP